MTHTEKIRLNAQVFKVAACGLLEFLFLITFTTNIAMHLSGALAGNASVSGALSGAFSGAQILVGLVLGNITCITKKYTLPVAMLSFSIGGILLILFPSDLLMLFIGALFCGFSQGIFIPQAMVDISNSVRPVATTMAVACFTCATCLGQLISPAVLNGIAKLLFGEVRTGYVYLVAVAGMTIAAIVAAIWKKGQK